jgi:ABC-type phosphate transport system substrate-binding protein
MKTLLTIISAVCVACVAANAQTSSTTTTTSGTQTQAADATTTTSTTTESTGTITEFTPGAAIVLNSGTGEPVRYKLGSSVTYINGKGKEIKADRIRKDRKVRVHYVKQGNDMVVDKITIVREKD